MTHVVPLSVWRATIDLIRRNPVAWPSAALDAAFYHVSRG